MEDIRNRSLCASTNVITQKYICFNVVKEKAEEKVVLLWKCGIT